jgi:hypothetical protein
MPGFEGHLASQTPGTSSLAFARNPHGSPSRLVQWAGASKSVRPGRTEIVRYVHGDAHGHGSEHEYLTHHFTSKDQSEVDIHPRGSSRVA